jgi:taurine dioxygenase
MSASDQSLAQGGRSPSIERNLASVFPEWRGLEMGPRTYLHEERARLAALDWKHFEVGLLGSTVGAELRGIDLRTDLPAEVFAEIRQALLDYKVIFFRDQPLDAAQQVAFAKRFGELELHPFIPPNPDHPELCRFEKSAELGGYENLWHHDVTWREKPSKIAILHAVAVPQTGGDTLFSDMYAAYDALDEEWKRRIDDMVVVHDYVRAFGGGIPEDKKAEMRARFPQPEHPAAGTHPETGRRYLFVNRVFVDHIKGMTREQSLPIIEHLARQAEYPEHQCRFHWTKDAIAIWDNRAVQHYAASDYWPDVRIMERASVVGERPVA